MRLRGRWDLEQVDPSFFFTERRWQALVKQLKKEGLPIPPRPAGAPPAPPEPLAELMTSRRMRTNTARWAWWRWTERAISLPALRRGDCRRKMPGRVGDSPIIGAGTYASNQSCAVSATGTGEYFIRLGVAREICNLVYFKGMRVAAGRR